MFELRSHVDYFRKEGKVFQRYDAIVVGRESHEDHPRLHLGFIAPEGEAWLGGANWQDAFEKAWSVPYADPTGHHFYTRHTEKPTVASPEDLQKWLESMLVVTDTDASPSGADLDATAEEERAKILTEKPVLVKSAQGVSPKGKTK